MNTFFRKLMPFVVLGITIFIFIIGLIVLSYILIFGALIGFILFLIQWLRERLSSPKPEKTPKTVAQKGRTIDHDHL